MPARAGTATPSASKPISAHDDRIVLLRCYGWRDGDAPDATHHHDHSSDTAPDRTIAGDANVGESCTRRFCAAAARPRSAVSAVSAGSQFPYTPPDFGVESEELPYERVGRRRRG